MKKYQQVDEQGKENLLKEYNQGASMIQLVGKYKVSSARIYQILRECEAVGKKVIFRKRPL